MSSYLEDVHAKMGAEQNQLSLSMLSLSSAISASGDVITKDTMMGVLDGKLEESGRNELVSAMEAIKNNILDSVEKDVKLSAAQLKAGMFAGLMSSHREVARRHLQTKSTGFEGIKLNPGDAIVSAFSFGSPERGHSIDTYSKAFESYDQNNGRNMQTWSIMWNTQATQQDAFGEAFFNTITLDPNQSAYHVTTLQRNIVRDVKRSLNGTVFNQQRVNLINAYRDSSVLSNDIIKIVPVWNDLGSEETKSSGFFVDPAKLPPTEVSYMGETVKTSALAFNKTVDLISISATKTLVQNGLLDMTDTLQPGARLSDIYLEIDGKVVRFTNIKHMSTATATPSVTGDSENYVINFNQALPLTKNTKSVDNAVHGGLAFLDGYTARINITVFGNISRDIGTTSLSAGEVTISRITSDDGVEIPLNSTASVVTTLKTKIASAKMLGWYIDASRSNTNLRQLGMIVEQRSSMTYYAVNHHSPISSVRPINQNEENDQSVIKSLVDTTRVYTSNRAVTSLLEFVNLVKEYARSKDKETNDYPDALGAARSMVKATYEYAALDVAAITGNLHSSDKLRDLQEQIILTLRDLATKTLVNSNYSIAMDLLYGATGTMKKPKLVIGTDQYIASLLMLNGDPRTLGDAFQFKIVYSTNKDMYGKIIFSFIDENVENKGVASPINAGNMVWSPEVVMSIPLSRGGSVSQYLSVVPKFAHVCNLPVFGELALTGISKYINSKPAFMVDNIEAVNPETP
jgi:hypothetical protein